MTDLARDLATVICARYPSATMASAAHATDPCLVIPPHHPAVGAVRVCVEGNGVVVEIGSHAHGHFATYDDPSPEGALASTVESVVAFLDDLFADRVVFWSAGGGGGWYYPDIPVNSPFQVPVGASKDLWSGPIHD